MSIVRSANTKSLGQATASVLVGVMLMASIGAVQAQDSSYFSSSERMRRAQEAQDHEEFRRRQERRQSEIDAETSRGTSNGSGSFGAAVGAAVVLGIICYATDCIGARAPAVPAPPAPPPPPAAAAAQPQVFAPPQISVPPVRTYRVVSVPRNDVLNMRHAPAGNIIGAIPPRGRGVALGECKYDWQGARWCLADYQGQRGWVATAYLAAE